MPSGTTPRLCACGTRLARSNRETRCAACLRRAGRDGGTAPDPPPSFWATDEMRDGFVRQHIGLISAAYREHRFHRRVISQERLGSWVDLTQAQVSRIESGPPVRDLDRLVHWARTLKIPPHLLWFDLPGETRSGMPTPRPAADRDATSLETIRAAAMAFRVADRQLGGGHLYPVVARYLRTEVGPRLVGREEHPAAAFSAASSLTDLAGWLAYDSHHREMAGRHFAQAFGLAEAAGDRALSAQALVGQSVLALENGRPAETVRLAEAGLATTPDGSGFGHLRARLMAMQARGAALLGHRAICLAALHRAEAEVGRAQPGGHEWLSPFDEASLATEAALCLRDLGRLPDAIMQAEQVLRLRSVDRVRSRAFSQLTLAGVHLIRGDLDATCVLGGQVLDVVPALDSARVVRQVRGLGRDLRPFDRAAGVHQFLGRLTATVPEPRTAAT